jgi:hypothetical protein
VVGLVVARVGWIGMTVGTSLAGASHAVCALRHVLLATATPSAAPPPRPGGYGEGIPGAAAANGVCVGLLHA